MAEGWRAVKTFVRIALSISGAITALLAFGFAFQLAWATKLWGWPDSRLSYIFLGSIAAAIAAPVIWIALSNELGAVVGGALNIATICASTGLYLLHLHTRRGEGKLLIIAVVLGVVFVLSVALFIQSRNIPIQDRRPIPFPVKLSFGIFFIALVAASTALLLRAAHVFPWPLRGDTSVMIGCIFLGNAIYFAYGLSSKYWGAVTGQLIAFLAYDLVLIGPFVRHFKHVLPAHRLSLTVYVIVLVGSGALSLYYLFISPSTRLWTRQITTPEVPTAP